MYNTLSFSTWFFIFTFKNSSVIFLFQLTEIVLTRPLFQCHIILFSFTTITLWNPNNEMVSKISDCHVHSVPANKCYNCDHFHYDHNLVNFMLINFYSIGKVARVYNYSFNLTLFSLNKCNIFCALLWTICTFFFCQPQVIFPAAPDTSQYCSSIEVTDTFDSRGGKCNTI